MKNADLAAKKSNSGKPPFSDIITGVAALYVIISLCRRFKAPAAQSA